MSRYPPVSPGPPEPPTGPPTGPPDTYTANPQDDEHIRLLSIFHYVMAGLSALGLCGALVGVLAGVALIAAPDQIAADDPELTPELATGIGWFYTTCSSCGGVYSLAVAVCQLVAASSLRAYRRRGFCIFVACLTLLSIPLGTILGIFTLVVLARPSVRMRFEMPDATPAMTR